MIFVFAADCIMCHLLLVCLAWLQFKQSQATIMRSLSERNAIQSHTTCVEPVKALDVALSSHHSLPSLMLVRSST